VEIEENVAEQVELNKEHGKDGNNGTDGRLQTSHFFFHLFRYFRLFRALFLISVCRRLPLSDVWLMMFFQKLQAVPNWDAEAGG